MDQNNYRAHRKSTADHTLDNDQSSLLNAQPKRSLAIKVLLDDGLVLTLLKAMSCCQSSEYNVLVKMFESDAKTPSTVWAMGCVLAVVIDYGALIYRGRYYGNQWYMPMLGFSAVDEPQHGALLTHMGSHVPQRWPFYIFSLMIAARVIWAMQTVCCPEWFANSFGLLFSEVKTQLETWHDKAQFNVAAVGDHAILSPYQSTMTRESGLIGSPFLHAAYNSNIRCASSTYRDTNDSLLTRKENFSDDDKNNSSGVSYERLIKSSSFDNASIASSPVVAKCLWPIVMVWSSYHWYRLLAFKFLAIYNNMLARQSCQRQDKWLLYFPQTGQSSCSYCVFDGITYMDSLTPQDCFDALLSQSAASPDSMIESLKRIQNLSPESLDLSDVALSEWSRRDVNALMQVLGNFSNQSFYTVTLSMSTSSDPIPYFVWSALSLFLGQRQLKNLTLSHLDFDTQSLHEFNRLIKNQTGLERLDLSGSNLGGVLDYFPPYLRTLNISGSGFDGSNVGYLIDFIQNNTDFNCLDISENKGISVEAFYLLMSAVSQSSIESLYLNGNDLYHVDWSRFFPSLLNSSVREIYLSNTGLYDEQFILLIPYLIRSRFSLIDLSFNHLSYAITDWFKAVYNHSVSGNESMVVLQHLDLSHNQFDGADLIELVPYLQHMRLQSLRLDNHDYLLSGLYSLGHMLLNSSLQFLSLAGCDGGDNFIRGLLDSLPHTVNNRSNYSWDAHDSVFSMIADEEAINSNPFNLKSLDLSDTLLSFSALQALFGNVSKIGSLKTLGLNDNTFFQPGIGRLIAHTVKLSQLEDIALQGINLNHADVQAICDSSVFKYLTALTIGGSNFNNKALHACANALVKVPEPHRLGREKIGVDLPQYMLANLGSNPYDLQQLSIGGISDLSGYGMRAMCQVRVGSSVSNFDVNCRQILSISSSASSTSVANVMAALLLMNLGGYRLSSTVWIVLLSAVIMFAANASEMSLVGFGASLFFDNDPTTDHCPSDLMAYFDFPCIPI